MPTKTVLLVEDEAEIADALLYVIKNDGMDAVWHSTAKAALEYLSTHHVDFAVLDVGLPDMSGFDLFKAIRQQHDIPAMFLTARSEEIDRIVGLEIGADDYVTKPFSPREVVVRVKNILKRVGDSQPASSHIEQQPTSKTGFEINADLLSIRYLNQPLELTRTEYLLLEVLIKSPQQIFSRRQLIEAIWSTQHPSDDRVIDTHIKSLRVKLKVINSSGVPIITHRGFGYSLLAK
jgi:two-component system catabolic regulation response regulator CreB